MPAPSGTQWGAVYGSGSLQGQIGVALSVNSTNTDTTVSADVWYRTKYSCYDSANTFYVDWLLGTVGSSLGAVSINHPVDYGSGWSESNQTKIGGTFTKAYARGRTAQTQYFVAKFEGIEAGGGSGSVSVPFTVPALERYTITYNANGGIGAPASQTKYFGEGLIITDSEPTRTGYTFLGWSTNSGATEPTYVGGSTFWANGNYTLYAVWKRDVVKLTYDANGGMLNRNGDKLLTVTLNYGDKIGTLVSPIRDYYEFTEWNTLRDGSGQKVGENTVITRDVTIYAQWELNTAVYVRDDGGYEVGIPYVKDGQQKEGVIYVRDDGTYKQGVV